MSDLREALDALPMPEPAYRLLRWSPWGRRLKSAPLHRDDAIRTAHRDGARVALERAVARIEASKTQWRGIYESAPRDSERETRATAVLDELDELSRDLRALLKELS